MRIIALITILSLAPVDVSAQSRLPFHFEIVPHVSLLNSAGGGNIDQWWNEVTENTLIWLDEKPEPFLAVDVTILFPRPESDLRIGIGAMIMLSDIRAYWGAFKGAAGDQVVTIMTNINAIKFPIKYRIPAYQEFSVILTPSLLLGRFYGSYDGMGTITNIKETETIGFGIETGFEVYYNKMLGIYIRGGFRILSADLIWEGDTAATLNSGDNVTVGFGGPYITIGITMRLAY